MASRKSTRYLTMFSLRIKLVQKLEKLGVENRLWPGRDDGFSSLFYGGKEFAHFHNDNELDIRLTSGVIKREGLTHPGDSQVHPNRSKNSQWIEIRFTRVHHVEEVVRLVKLAIERL